MMLVTVSYGMFGMPERANLYNIYIIHKFISHVSTLSPVLCQCLLLSHGIKERALSALVAHAQGGTSRLDSRIVQPTISNVKHPIYIL